MVDGIWLVVLGILGASSLSIARKPDAKEQIAKIAPYQGWIGAVSALWGVKVAIFSFLSIGWLSTYPIPWITWIVDGALQAALGLLLGVGTLKTFIKNPQANQRMDQTIAKLAPFQGTLGLVAIGFGVWKIISGFLFTVS